MIKTAIFFCLLSFGITCFARNNLFFEKEDITFEIKDSVLIVQGIYYFNSSSEKKYSILYPFPTDSIYSNPFKIKVSYINSNQPIDFKIASDSSSIVFRIIADIQQPIHVSYQQQLKSNTAKYILLSTNRWQRPLEQVDYKLVTDLDFQITGFSIKPDKKIQIDNNNLYLWHKENFTPQKDFIIYF
ncbi:MAG: hypothetical protein K9H26_18245 [Prolixibacteraceae bacterium]|nr:hypothetical protein [Prolixibacteraceae bacterium]